MTPEQQQEVQKRQRGRAIVMALCLGLLVVLIFGIAWSKIANGTMH
jgi:uncharacterized membrane protein affecting hemolysin expression